MADSGFRIAGAYVTVNLQDNTEADEQRMRARLEGGGPVTLGSALNDPDNLQIVKDKIKASSAATIRTDVAVDDTALAKAKVDAEKAGADSGTAFTKGASDSINRDRSVESATSDVAKRANAQFSAIQAAVMFAGLPTAAAVAGAGVAAGLSIVPVALAAISAAALKSDAAVAGAWSSMVTQLKGDAAGWAQPFQQEFVDAAGKVSAAANQLSPEITTAARSSADSVGILTDSVIGLADNAMPGLMVAAANTRAPLLGVQEAAIQAGSGVSSFFTNLSTGAQSSQGIITTAGGAIRDLLGFAGQLFANISNNGGPALQGFSAALSQVESTVLTLTASTSPLYGAVGGFLSTVSGGLSIVQGFAAALQLLPSGVSNFGGSLLATQKIASLFGTSLSGTGFGLNAFASSVDSAGKTTTPFGTAVKGASGFVDKFSAGVGSIVSSGFNPLGIALVAGSALLDLWGKSSQEAAAVAAEHAKAVDDLTTAFQRDNGVIGANVAATTSKALADKNAYANANVFGVSMDTVSRAGLGQADAMNQVVSQAKDYVTGLLSGNQANRNMLPTILQNVDAFAKQGGNASDLVNNLSAVRMNSLDLTDAQKSLLIQTLDGVAAIGQEGQATIDAAQKQAAMQAALDKTSQILHDQMTPGMYAAQVSTANLKTAFDALNTAGGDVVAKGQAIIQVLDQLSGKQMSAEDAMQAFNNTVRDLAKNLEQAQSGGSRFSSSMVDATGAINTTTAAGSSLQDTVQQAAQNMASYGQALADAGTPADQITAKLGGMRDALAAQLKQLGLTPPQIDSVLAHYNALPSDIVTALHLEGAPETQQAITNLVTQLQQVPANKGIHVDALTTDAESALIQLGYHIVQLPNGQFQIFANTQPGQAAADTFAAQNFGRVITMVLDANAQPANGKITATVVQANGSIGTMTLDAHIDPATHQTMVAVQQANGARGYMTVDAFNQAAKDVINGTVMVANGARGFIQVDANAGPANSAIDYAARNRTSTIYVNTVGGTSTSYATGAGGTSTSGAYGPRAQGGIDVPGTIPMAVGGLLGMSHLATVVPPNMPRLIGDNMRVPEAFIPLDPQSSRSQAILEQTNAAMGRPSSSAPAIDYSALAGAVAQAVDAVFAGGIRASWDTTTMEKGLITLARRRAAR